MHLFEIFKTDGTMLSIFGESFDDAATLFAAWHIVNHKSPLPDFEIRQRNPFWPGVNSKHLFDALATETPGFGRYDPVKGWTIVSPLNRGEASA